MRDLVSRRPHADITNPGRASPSVLFVINGLGTGGAERSLCELLPYLQRDGFRCSVVCLFERQEGVQELVRKEVPVRILDGRSLPAKARALRRHVRNTRPDVVHTSIFEADLLGRLAAWGESARVVTTLVSTPYARSRLQDSNIGAWRLWGARSLDGWTARHLTDHFHAITHTVRRAAVESLHIRPEHVTVIERGRDPSRLGKASPERRSEVRKRLGISEKDHILLNVGRNEFAKGQTDLLRATRMLVKEDSSVILLIAGRPGNSTNELKRLAEDLRLGDRVRFLGHREDVPNLMSAADIFVFPSLYEGLGGALIEAMALELPIVASDLESIREVVTEGQNAELVPARSPRLLASAVETLMRDGSKRALYGRRGREIFERRFTLERSATAVAALLRGVATDTSLYRRRR